MRRDLRCAAALAPGDEPARQAFLGVVLGGNRRPFNRLKLAGRCADNDLGVFKIVEAGLKALSLLPTSSVQLGDGLFAAGELFLFGAGGISEASVASPAAVVDVPVSL